MYGKLAATAFLSLAASEPVAESFDGVPKVTYEDTAPERTEISPQEWATHCKPWDDWNKPAPPFRIDVNTFYVGTCGITVLFVRTRQGSVVIDTGTEKGAAEVWKNLRLLKANSRTIGALLYSHEHFDHVGGMDFIRRRTGAPVLSAPEAVEVFLTGKANPNDPQAGMHKPMNSVANVIPIEPGTPVHFGGTKFTPIATPGHTPGALTWQWESCAMHADNRVCKTIVYADSLSPISSDGYKFSDHPEYVAKYRAGIARLRELECDILLTPHPSHSKMVERAATGSFEGGMTCEEYADSKTKALDARLAKEQAGE